MKMSKNEFSVFTSLLITGILVSMGWGQSAGWVIDGLQDERYWDHAETLEFSPSREGGPRSPRGTLYVVVQGDWLFLAARLSEPGGKVMARSIGDNPVWEQYALTSPAVEDRVCIEILDQSSRLEIAVNPWGAMRVERDSSVVSESGILRAADINASGWSVELALPTSEIFSLDRSGEVRLSAERIRSQRPLSPESRWKTAELRFEVGTGVDGFADVNPVQRARKWGNVAPPLQVGRVQKVPPLDAPWEGGFWQEIPGFELPRNEPNPRRAEYPTRVKWVHDGETLQLFFENTEDGRLNVDVDSRDGSVGSDDHVAVYLALTGSASVEILANPVGAIRDAKSSGPRGFGTNSGAFNGSVTGNFIKEEDRWMVRLNLPLAEIAVALGGKGVPKDWRVLIGRVRQARLGEPAEVSTLPVIESSFLNAPARFTALHLSDRSPSEITPPHLPVMSAPENSQTDQLKGLNPYALTRVQRSYYDSTNMIFNQIDRRTKLLAMEEHEEWDKVENLQDWELYRNKRISALKVAWGDFPAQKCDLDYRVNSIYKGDGYQILNIAYQSRPGFYIAANLYLPADPAERIPGMIILPAHHYPKTDGEMKDCGIVWARSGTAVLIPEHIGFGERLETSPLYRQGYESEYLLSQQLELVGQSLEGWIVFDVVRTVDLFESLGSIDMDRVILIGSVTWGGGRRAAPAGLYDERIDGEVIYNFGRVYWYGWGTRNLIRNKISPWFIVNAFAPRKLVYAHEFWWEGEEGPGYPEVWVPAWSRYQKVYSFYGKENNLAAAQGIGLLRAGPTEFIPRGDCFMLGTVQRKSLYPVLKRWFNIPYPSEADQNIPLDSRLSDARELPEYPVIKYQESLRRPSDEDILSIPAGVSEELDRRALHQIAYDMGVQLLARARQARKSLATEEVREALRAELSELLGDIEPEQRPRMVSHRNQRVTIGEVEYIVLESEQGILVPLILLRPGHDQRTNLPVVLALAEGGKSRFLRDRASQLVELLRRGFAVCIPDVRGTGETSFSQYNRGDEPALSLAELGESLMGGRLKDVRTVLIYLRSRGDVDADGIRLWGDSFAPANSEPIWVDELLGKPVSPQIQHVASPLGAHLALLAALYDSRISRVAVRGGLVSYLSLLESNFVYVPSDVIVSGLLEVADIEDVVAALSPVPLFLATPVSGRNFPATQAEIQQSMEFAVKAYEASAELVLSAQSEEPGKEIERMVEWLASQDR